MEVGLRDARILTDAEVATLVKALRKMLGPEFAALSTQHGLGMADGIRFHAVGTKCFLARAKLGLTIKEAAATLRVPQYRLNAIERSSTCEVRGDIVGRYASLLKLDGWLHRWATANRRLASKLGIQKAASSRRLKNRAPSNIVLYPASVASVAEGAR